jgi:prepilin-type N-terminal cleavage/methylation domain-containing protein
MKARGFTLLELLVVMAIMGLLVGLVGPFTVRQYDKIQVVKEREQLLQLIQRIRFISVIEQADHPLSVQGASISSATLQQVEFSFQHLRFPPQQLQINSNGFWLEDYLYWQEQEVRWRIKLNPERLQTSANQSSPAPEIVP